MSIKASLPPTVPPPPYSGRLVESIEQVVALAEGAGAASESKRPTLIHKQDGRNYFRLTELPPNVELHCATADCSNNAHVLSDSRHGEILPYCKDCAHVEFAMWMVGV